MREQYVGHIRAGDEQHEERNRQHDSREELRKAGGPEYVREHRQPDGCRDRFRRRPGTRLVECVELRCCGLPRVAVAEHSEDLDHPEIAVLAKRSPDVLVPRKAEALRHHADDLRRCTAHTDDAPEDPRIAIEPGAPDLVADENDRGRAGRGIRSRERATEHGLHRQQCERRCRDRCGGNSLGRSTLDGQVHHAPGGDTEPVEERLTFVPVEIRVRGNRRTVGACHLHDPITVLEWQCGKDCAVDDAEHQRAQSDAYRERGDDREARRWRLDQTADTETQVAENMMKHRVGSSPAMKVPVEDRAARRHFAC